MKVSELIKELSKANPDAEVIIEVMEQGLVPVDTVEFRESHDNFFEDIDVDDPQVSPEKANVVFLY